MNSSKAKGLLRPALLGLILVVGAFLRLYNLRSNPGWYPDEGSNLNVAWNLWQGRIQYFAVGGSMLVNARAPLFPLFLAGFFDLFGYDILIARLVSAISGIATIPLLYFSLKGSQGHALALVVSGVFSILPLAVLYNRWAFDYNLLMPLSVLILWACLKLIKDSRPRWMVLAAILVGLAILTAWVEISLLAVLFLVGWFTNRRSLLWGIPLAAALPVAFLLFSFIHNPPALGQDLYLTFSRTESSPLAQLVSMSGGYSLFIASNFWLAPAILGMFLVNPRRVRVLSLALFFIPLLFTVRFAYLPENGMYRILGLVPFLSIGLASLLLRGIPWIAGQVFDDLEAVAGRWRLSRFWPRLTQPARMLIVPLVLWFSILDVFAFTLIAEVANTLGDYPTRFDEVLARPERGAAESVAFVNHEASPDDVVISSPQVGWAIKARVADFQQTLSYEGYSTDNYPIPIQRDRFLFDPTPQNARYAIVDRMWREWGPRNIVMMPDLLREVTSWDPVFQSGDYVVYRNPLK